MSLRLRRLTLCLAIFSAQAPAVFSQDAVSNAPTVTVSPAMVNPGGTITVTFANGPGNPKDWVALSEVGSPPTTSVVWKYIGGVRSGTVDLVVPKTAPPGAYEIQFRLNDGFVRLATSSAIVVQPTSGATVTAVPATLRVGGTVTVSVSGAPGKMRDWVALLRAGSAANSSPAWKYTGGQTSGTVEIVVPRTAMPGVYVARLLESDGYAALATSKAITLEGASDATVAVSPATLKPGDTVTISIEGGPGNPKDWVTLSAVAAPATSSIVWKYLGGATTTAQVQLLVPRTAPPGLYEVRFLENDGFVVLAKSAVVAILAP